MTQTNILGDVDLSQLPPIDTIDREHREQIEARVRELTANAETEADVVRVLRDLIEQTLNGMTIGEDGSETRVVGGGQAEYWSAPQIEAEAGSPPESSRNSFLLIMGVAFAVLIFVGWTMYSNSREDELPEQIEATAIPSEVAEMDRLDLADDLGGRTRLGQPSTVELFPSLLESNNSTTLAVVNAPVEGRSMPILDEMSEGALVTQWLYGSVVNYVFGVSPALIENMTVGSAVVIRNDTGNKYSFACTEQSQVAVQQSEIFAQNRPGVTLFPLPSPSSTMTVIWCPYDPTTETEYTDGRTVVGVGQPAVAPPVSMTVTDVFFNSSPDGNYALQLKGHIESAEGGNGVVIMSLSSPTGRYSPDGDTFTATEQRSNWEANFRLPPAVLDQELLVEIRSPAGGASTIAIGKFVDPIELIEARPETPQWDDSTSEIVLDVLFDNSGDSSARITSDMISVTQDGQSLPIYTNPPLPIAVLGQRQERVGIRIVPGNSASNIELRILNTVWDIRDVPTLE